MADAVTAETTEDKAPDQAGEVEVNEAQLPEAVDSGQRTAEGKIDLLLDVSVSVTVRLGEADIEVRELLSMGPGSVLQLDKKVGEPVDLLLRGHKFATGSLVSVEGKLGVRISEIVDSP